MQATDANFIGKKLKVGLIVDSDEASKYTLELATWAKMQPELEISHLILQNIPRASGGSLSRLRSSLRKNGPRHIVRNRLFNLIAKFETRLLRSNPHHGDHMSGHDLVQHVSGRIEVTPEVSKSGFVFRYGDSDLEKIRSEKFDCLIRCGSGILRGGILTAAKHGILSFHHADSRVNRGSPPAFWEVHLQQSSTGFVVQQLTEELDGGNVLVSGSFPTQYFYLKNQAQLFAKANVYLKKLLLDVARNGKLPLQRQKQPYYNPLYKLPGTWTQLRYAATLVSRIITKQIEKRITKKSMQWSVAFAPGSWTDLVYWRATVIPDPPNHFLADPFVYTDKSGSYCFVEDFDNTISRAHIAVYRLGRKSSERLGEALIEPFHLSFPYIFEYDGKLYMTPEACESRSVRLYECKAFPLQWELKNILLQDVSAVDPMLFEYNGTWWMLINIDPSNTGEHCSELQIFHADSPLSTDWIPHPMNPVIVDSNRARNGGLLKDGDDLYRVSQRQGFDLYGEGAAVNRIVELTKTTYREEIVTNIDANFFPHARGTHHLHSNGQVTVFDFVAKR